MNYEIVKNGSNQRVFEFKEDIDKLRGTSTQLIVEKILPLTNLEPGAYTINVKAEDRNRKQTVGSSAIFTIQ